MSNDQSSMRRRAETHETNFARTAFVIPDGMSMFSVKTATPYTLELMAYLAGEGNPYQKKVGGLHPERTFFTHQRVGPGEDSYICNFQTFGEPCYVCEYRAEAARNPNANKQYIKDLAPKERQLWLPKNYAEPEKGVQLWESSFHLFGKQLDARIKNSDPVEDGYEWFFHPGPKGLKMKVGFVEKTLPTNKYWECATIDFKPRGTTYTLADIQKMPCLDKLLIKTPYEKLREVFMQTAPSAGVAQSAASVGGHQAPAGTPVGAANPAEWDAFDTPAAQAPPVAEPPPARQAPPAQAPAATAPIADNMWDFDAPAPAAAPAAPVAEPPPRRQAPAAQAPAPIAAPVAAPVSDENWDNWR